MSEHDADVLLLRDRVQYEPPYNHALERLLARLAAAEEALRDEKRLRKEFGEFLTETQKDSAYARSAAVASVEGREGMVTGYDHEGRYLGCMGIETWRAALAEAQR